MTFIIRLLEKTVLYTIVMVFLTEIVFKLKKGILVTSHCKGCKFHHIAGHPKDSRLIKYNDWCCAFGKTASKCVGHCKLQNAKELK